MSTFQRHQIITLKKIEWRNKDVAEHDGASVNTVSRIWNKYYYPFTLLYLRITKLLSLTMSNIIFKPRGVLRYYCAYLA